MSILGAAACVLAVMAGVGFGQTWVATMSNLPRAYPDKYKPLALAIYLAVMIAGVVAAGVGVGGGVGLLVEQRTAGVGDVKDALPTVPFRMIHQGRRGEIERAGGLVPDPVSVFGAAPFGKNDDADQFGKHNAISHEIIWLAQGGHKAAAVSEDGKQPPLRLRELYRPPRLSRPLRG